MRGLVYDSQMGCRKEDEVPKGLTSKSLQWKPSLMCDRKHVTNENICPSISVLQGVIDDQPYENIAFRCHSISIIHKLHVRELRRRKD